MEIKEYKKDLETFYTDYSSNFRLDSIKGIIVSVFGAGEHSGKETFVSNLSLALSEKLKVLYLSSKNTIPPIKKINISDDFFAFIETKYQNIKALSFSPKSSFLSMDKMEEMLLKLPSSVKENFNFFIHSVKDPFGFPDRYILLNNSINIIVAEIDSNIFSNIFQIIEKVSFLPRIPKEIFLVLNKCNTQFLGFDYYQRVLFQVNELKIPIKLYFLGSIPYDELRCRVATESGLLLGQIYNDSPIWGSFKFIAKKLINYSIKISRANTKEIMISMNR